MAITTGSGPSAGEDATTRERNLPPGEIVEKRAPRGRTARFFEAWPPSVLLALGWILAMLFIAAFVEILAAYSYTAMDLRARLTPPVFWEAPTSATCSAPTNSAATCSRGSSTRSA